MNYNEAYNKIIDAYFKDEIKPMESEFCFCGTLNGNSGNWIKRESGELEYSYVDFGRMEHSLLSHLEEFEVEKAGDENGNWICWLTVDEMTYSPNYEAALFAGMCAALEVLKEIHRERGEDVDALPALTKRILCTK